MYSRQVEILSRFLENVFVEKTGASILGIQVDRGKDQAGLFEVAQVIEYRQKGNSSMEQLVAGFPQKDTALELAGYMAEQLKLPEPDRLSAMALELLTGFMNAVMGGDPERLGTRKPVDTRWTSVSVAAGRGAGRARIRGGVFSPEHKPGFVQAAF